MVNNELLRRDVRTLGDMLGDVIRELAGESALERVEQIRKVARERRSGVEEAEGELAALIEALDEPTARDVTRAFSIFFDLANIAEDRHRVRILRSRELERHPQPRSESIGEAIAKLKGAGFTPVETQSALDRLAIELVFTAHPSEAKRRSLRVKLRRMRQALEDLDLADLLPRERQKLENLLRTEMTALWQTEFLRPNRPTVLQEVRRGLTIAPRLWEVVPGIYDDLRRALEVSYPGVEFRLPLFLKFGSWIGGDRDGHPHVTRDVTAQTLLWLREAAIEAHLKQCRQLSEFLSISTKESSLGPQLNDEFDAATKKWPVILERVQTIPSTESCRLWLAVIEWRLEQSFGTSIGEKLPEGAYRDGAELEQDVLKLVNSLEGLGTLHLIRNELLPWLDLVRVFGLHMNRLDVRQDARRHIEALTEIFAKAGITANFEALPEEERQEVLTRTMPWKEEISHDGLSPHVVETLELFRLLHAAMATFGPSCVGSHIISLTSAPSDMLSVLWLWRWAQSVGNPPGTDVANLEDQLAIAPLFEKIGDLRRGPETLEAILKHPVYASHVQKLGSRQIVMVGYSDSTKDGGYLAACWGLYRSQSELQRTADRYGVKLTFFHGRGGSLGRGGGPAARGIYSLPPEALDGSLRLTEQGEVLAERYDDDQIAYRHLEQVTSATLLASALPARTAKPAWSVIMEQLSRRSYQAYRELVDQPGFIEFFSSATPIDEIESLNIGSRPARRRGERTLADLRAIPWVFSWTQNRSMIPAWYGLGTALTEVLEERPNDWQTLYEMYRQWPFFQATIENAALALAKADEFISSRYADLVQNTEVRDLLGGLIDVERDRSRKTILALTGGTDLLSATPWLQASIDARNPYIDPLNLIQIELVQRRRSLPADTPPEDAERLGGLLRLTVQGIAAGMRTTG
ncbi:phosphoenolpyruvate carboxylase [Schlesneria sp. T3-172]|uniref:phosphoenolpyruvate carboxylase n=1 Tax=Schlesneria sphaerica TaxID=3373610 RepID=UPI0037C887B9